MFQSALGPGVEASRTERYMSSKVVFSLIDEVKGRGKVGIMVTHDLAMAELADRVLEMHDGALHTVRRAS